jgi:hypothetical protein
VHDLVVTRHIVVSHDPSRRLLRIVRSPAPVERPEELRVAVGRLERASASLDVSTTRVLVDARAAPLRSDETFEIVWRELSTVLARFEKVATVVQTAVGELQTTRLAQTPRSDGTKTSARTFRDEGEAMAWLLGPDAGPRPG